MSVCAHPERPWDERQGEVHASQQDRFTGRLVPGAQGASGAREGIDAVSRPHRGRTARTALAEDPQGLCLRDRARAEETGRPVRRQQPADRLPFHVRAGLRSSLRRLLLPCRPYRRRQPASQASRRVAGRDLARAAGRTSALQAAHGLEIRLGVVLCLGLQLRHAGLLHRQADRGRRHHLQFRDPRPEIEGPSRHQRVLQGRERRHLPDLHVARPRRRPQIGAYTIST